MSKRVLESKITQQGTGKTKIYDENFKKKLKPCSIFPGSYLQKMS